jgi:hypothetical protein
MWRISNGLALIAALISVVYVLVPSLPLKDTFGPYLLPVAVGLIALQGILVVRGAERNQPAEATQVTTIPIGVRAMPTITVPTVVSPVLLPTVGKRD